MKSLEKITKVRLPYDMRNADDKKNYGVGGLSVWFILKGTSGAVQFHAYFPIFLPHVAQEWRFKRYNPGTDPEGHDVGYHAREQQYEGQNKIKCELMDGDCHYDGSSLRAAEWAKEIFSIRGESPENEIWRRLEIEYTERFGDEK